MKISTVKIILLCSLLFILTSCELIFQFPKRGHIEAIFIALDYGDSDDALEGTIRDAKELELALEGLSERFGQSWSSTKMYQEGQESNIDEVYYPTKEHVLNLISEKVKILEDNELLLIYYAGHGHDKNNDFALALADKSDSAQIEELSKTELMQTLTKRTKGDILLILDTCFSGGYVSPYDPTNSQYEPHITTFSASREYEESLEYPFPFSIKGHQHGYFTGVLLEALGWDHVATEKEVDGDKISTPWGALRADGHIPALKEGVISVGSLYRYIDNRLQGQHTMTVNGPKDIALFSKGF